MIARTLLALSLVLNPALASDLPDLGEVSRQYFSDQDEQMLAQTIMRDVYANPQYLDDPEIENYLNQLGYLLVSVSPRNQRVFNFFVIQDDSINAFALPGGNIGVHTGLLLAAQNESELAGVVAHEISHVTQDHLARMVAAQSQSQIPTLAALAVALLAARSMNYSRDYEREADRMGYDMLTKAGFDPRGMSGFFNRLIRANRFYETNAPAYLRTHPLTTDRVSDMEARSESAPYQQIQDSLDFQLVRARLRAQEGNAAEAVKTTRAALDEKRYSNETAARYGYATALLRARDYRAAEAQVQALLASSSNSPMIHQLAARAALEAGKPTLALQRFEAGLARYPGSRPLLYGHIEALLNAGRAEQSLTVLEKQRNQTPHDRRLWTLSAKAHAQLGQRLQSHRAQAEAAALSGNLVAAIEQISLGIKAGDGSFHELSAAEARRRGWQEMQKAQRNP